MVPSSDTRGTRDDDDDDDDEKLTDPTTMPLPTVLSGSDVEGVKPVLA